MSIACSKVPSWPAVTTPIETKNNTHIHEAEAMDNNGLRTWLVRLFLRAVFVVDDMFCYSCISASSCVIDLITRLSRMGFLLQQQSQAAVLRSFKPKRKATCIRTYIM
mmetsp:Transcript_18114/g.24918  ORF Transcript_18114/g.24918 Transcript_18114/m.24918 type:complete len:108 (-) Transcript_18114:85-408(-)